MRDTLDIKKFRMIFLFSVIQTILAITLFSVTFGKYFFIISFQSRIVVSLILE